MGTATEIVRLPLRNSMNVADGQVGTVATLAEIINTILQQSGLQRLFWATEIETPSEILMFVDWDSEEAHRAFQKTSAYQPFIAKLDQIVIVSKVHANYVHFSDLRHLSILDGTVTPVTEVGTFWFPWNYSDDDQDIFNISVDTFVTNTRQHAFGFVGFAGAWETGISTLPATSERAKAFVACFGWVSVEAQAKFRMTKRFKEVDPLLSKAKALKTVEVVHIKGNLLDSLHANSHAAVA